MFRWTDLQTATWQVEPTTVAKQIGGVIVSGAASVWLRDGTTSGAPPLLAPVSGAAGTPVDRILTVPILAQDVLAVLSGTGGYRVLIA